MISINNNLSALNTAHALSGHYGRLQTSTQRLSSGLRINGAADDAAGLAIRELMRADIAALNQGVRNVNDAISMLQTFDGALGVIDEKLIRMKELAEQAATGTYDSTQRLMIDSEFQAMGEEINRIARATDFNGIKLLCAKMITWTAPEDRFFITDKGTPSNHNVVLNNVNAANYIDKANTTRTISVNLTAKNVTEEYTGTLPQNPPSVTNQDGSIITTYNLGNSPFKVAVVESTGNGNVNKPIISYKSNGDWIITDAGNRVYTIVDWATSGSNNVVGTTVLQVQPSLVALTIGFSMTDDKNAPVNLQNMDPEIKEISFDTAANTYKIVAETVEIKADTPDYKASYNADNQTVTVNLNKGGTATLKLDNALAANDTVAFDITFAGLIKTVDVEQHGVDPDQKLKIHFGTMNDSAEDYYYINYENCTREGLGLDGVDIKTQDNAQNALVDINEAIVKKDKVRAKFGAMQNRLENTATNLRIQSENLQAAESRISDTEIAMEMMNFVRNQILSNSAVAMLAQANSLPQMVMALIH